MRLLSSKLSIKSIGKHFQQTNILTKLNGGTSANSQIEPDFRHLNQENFIEEFDSSNKLTSFLSQSYISTFLKNTPLITLFYVSSSVFLTTLSFIFNSNDWFEVLDFDIRKIFTKLQIWRLITPFFHLGPMGLNYLLTIQFLSHYLSQLERLHLHNPAKFLMSLIFGSVLLLVSYSVSGLSPRLLGHNLSSYFVYLWAKAFEGTDVNFMDFLSLRAETLPWLYCVQSLLLEGEFPVSDLLGIAIGHMYLYVDSSPGLRWVVRPWRGLRAMFSTPWVREWYIRGRDIAGLDT